LRNYFNYFTEIEERFQQRRGSFLLLSTIDWALIESWRDAGIPLEAVLRGIDSAFDKRESSKAGRAARKINGLAWCAQAVMEEAEAIEAALVGLAPSTPQDNTGQSAGPGAGQSADFGFEPARIAAHLHLCAQQLQSAKLREAPANLAAETISRLNQLATQTSAARLNLEELERTLSVMEGKLLSMLLATEPEADLVTLREQAARELAPYRSRMKALQIRQIEQQFLHKRLLEKYALPRLSLFYMSQS
jgi:sulfur relay (sulfurtransferase) DsrF/TusC family protein